MKNDQFIKALKKALSGMDKASRKEVLKEIESHGVDSGDNLYQQFGEPEALAQQYSEGEVASTKTSVAKKVAHFGKQLLMALGILLVVLIALGFFLKWKFSGDAFNYADEVSLEKHTAELTWQKLKTPLPLQLDIAQSQVQLFWHDGIKINWSCKGEEPEVREGKIRIYHSQCMLFLPPIDAGLTIEQAQVVIVKPQGSLNISSDQAALRIAEGEHQYRYAFKAEKSHIEGLSSHDSAEKMISIKAHESSVKPYVFSESFGL